jgi:hypothetical protein
LGTSTRVGIFDAELALTADDQSDGRGCRSVAVGMWRYDVVMTEMPLPEGEQLALVAREAAESGQVVYLTDHGQRLAAIVPASLAELLEHGAEVRGGRRVLGARGAGRSGRHDISERIEEILASEVTS